MQIDGIEIAFDGDPCIAAIRAVELLAMPQEESRSEQETPHSHSNGQPVGRVAPIPAQSRRQPRADAMVDHTPDESRRTGLLGIAG